MAKYTKLTDLWVSGLLKVTGAITALGGIVGNVTGYAVSSQVRAATSIAAEGGKISPGITHAIVTSDGADKIIYLPEPVLGLEITIFSGAGSTGYELRTSNPATIGINGGVGENAESAIAANMILVMRCVSATNWIGTSYTAAGVAGVVQVAAP